LAAERILVAFGSGSEDLIEEFLDNFARVAPELPLYVVSEFAPHRGRWIPWGVGRTYQQNRDRIRDSLQGKEAAHVAILLQPRQPFWPMRGLGFLTAPGRVLCFNENLDHFALHPRSAWAIARHLVWRAGNLIRWETSPGGWCYTQAWRLLHPWSLRRPLHYRRALLAGRRAAQRKRALAPVPMELGSGLPEGVTVVIPSRDGRALLERLLLGLMENLADLAHEVVVVDNGSSDGTTEWLASEYPAVRVEASADPLSFAAAVNRGIRGARYSHTLLLNNDMVLEAGAVRALRVAFGRVPDLFCATAQIFFPEGKRREETGKAVHRREAAPTEFPVWCEAPVEGEDLTPVTYGSGGCSLYDTAKLKACGGVGECFTPAYVEDLDLGWRAWVRGWPTVFVAGARVVHHHQSTTRRYFTEDEIRQAVEVNYLRFLARSVADADLFMELWARAVLRVNYHAAQELPPQWALPALRAALDVEAWVEAPVAGAADERRALALGGGETAWFPGRARDVGRPLVLIASPYVPFPLSHGGAVRMYNLMREAAREFDLALVAFCGGHEPVPRELLELCTEVVLVRRQGSHLRPMTDRPEVVEEHDTPPFRAALGESIRRHVPALVQLEFTQMAAYARDCAGLPTVLVEHDITLDLYAQLLARQGDWETREQLARWERFERQAWGEVSCVVTMSEKDRGMVEGARRVVALENGVDLAQFRHSGRAPEERRLLFIGSFAHLPNLMALRWFLDETWARLREAGVTLHIIAGARPDHFQDLYRDRVTVELDQPGLEVEGFVSDVRPAYERATVVIAPLLASAGTNIKIMEAMAMGKAIVSTAAGVNGLELEAGADYVPAESGVEMAAAILDLCENPERREALERRARATVERRFDWKVIGEAQARLYRELMA
jgi:O-antigen biosynthesis protein